MYISSASNGHIRQIRELLTKSKERRRQRCFVAEGIRMVSETPKDRLVRLYLSESFSQAHQGEDLPGMDRAVIIKDSVFKEISDTMNPQGILAIVSCKENALEDLLNVENPMLLFLENIQDPGNLGTMLRTAEGAGCSGIIMSRDTVDIYNPKVIRSTMGALYRMPFVYAEDFAQAIEAARARGIKICAAHLEGSVVYDEEDYKGPCGIMIGNEGKGLTKASTALSDARIRIPMEGQLESLNAAVSAAVLMYEVYRQRRH